MKKILCLFLAAVFVLAGAGVAAGADEAPAAQEEFVPVIRFVASSDTHVKEDDDTNAKRIPMMMEIAYAQAEADPSYTNLDALIVAGDLTDQGTKKCFDNFWEAVSGSLRDGTRFLGVAAKNHDGWNMSRRDVHEYYKSLTGNDPDFHVVINGFHFIGLSASDDDAQHYDSKQLSWLKEQFDAAIKEDPNKPVFFIHHEHNRDTVYGSSFFDGWGITNFKSILNNYPQVVDFSGHSHYPLNDPRSVWQGKYTAIGTGAIYYSEFTIDESRAYDPPDCRETATFWLVELDASNNMRLRGYDVNENKLLVEYMMKNPADPANRDFAQDKIKAKSSAPAFAPGTQIQTEPQFGGCKATVHKADSTDTMPVTLYRFYAKNSLGITLAKDWVLPDYYRAIEQDEIEYTFENLPAGEYTISVVAENAYGMQSPSVETKVTIEGETGIKAVFMVISSFFTRIAEFIVHLFG